MSATFPIDVEPPLQAKQKYEWVGGHAFLHHSDLPVPVTGDILHLHENTQTAVVKVTGRRFRMDPNNPSLTLLVDIA